MTRIFPFKINHYQQSSGVALVSVLLLLAVLVTLLSYMIENQFLSLRQASFVQQDMVSTWEGHQAYSWAISMLLKQQKNDYESDSLSEAWNTESFVFQGTGQIDASIVDLQSKFNLNNLSEKSAHQDKWIDSFKKLLDLLSLDQDIAYKVVDWIDADSLPYPGGSGAEDLFYTLLDPARRTANQNMASVEELLMIDEITLEVYQQLLPYVCVLPVHDTTVNLNTSSLELLQSIIPDGVSSGVLQQFVDEREETSLNNVTDLNGFLSNFSVVSPPLNTFLGVNSEYFELASSSSIDDQSRQQHIGIKRQLEATTNEVKFSILYRKRML